MFEKILIQVLNVVLKETIGIYFIKRELMLFNNVKKEKVINKYIKGTLINNLVKNIHFQHKIEYSSRPLDTTCCSIYNAYT